MKYGSIFVGVIFCALMVMAAAGERHSDDRPYFIRADRIAARHATDIDITVWSLHHPTELQLQRLATDYSSLWAHLNHLYRTNEVQAGKDYYTEAWFRRLCSNDQGLESSYVERVDVCHDLHILNWSRDGLVCAAIDSNLVFHYESQGRILRSTKATIAMVLLFQGDHWRIDALRMINEIEI